MLRNIHPNPDKRMTPQETKAFFVSIFYECWMLTNDSFHFNNGMNGIRMNGIRMNGNIIDE
jgi:hypothetical protein